MRPNSLILLVGAGVLTAGFGGCGGGSVGLPYRAPFSRDCHGWPTQDDRLLKAGCTKGQYQVLVRSAKGFQFFTIPVRGDSLKVELDARVAAGPGPRKYGIGCFRGDRSGQWFVLAPGKGYQLVLYDEFLGKGVGNASVVAEEKHPISEHRTHRIVALCTSDRPDSLGSSGIFAMWVDGKFVDNFVDATYPAAAAAGEQVGSIEHVGIVVFPSAAGSDVRFANFAVERASQNIGFGKP